MIPIQEEKLKMAKQALLCMQRHSWEHGTAMQAFLEAGDMDIVVLMAKAAADRMLDDGRPAIIAYPNAVTDPCSVAEGVHAAWKETQDPQLGDCVEQLKKWMSDLAPRNEKGIVYHLDDSCQFWVDSAYMLPANMAALGDVKGAVHQMVGYWNTLYDEESGLMKHIWNDETKIFDRDVCWGVGNGWALAGMARLIDMLPGEMENEKRELTAKASTLLTNVMEYRCEDGFHDIVNDPSTFTEVNLAQMCAYTIYRGIASGWLEADPWLEQAESLRALCEQNLDRFGILRNACAAPDFNSPGTAPEAQAFYVMMETAAKKLQERCS